MGHRSLVVLLAATLTASAGFAGERLIEASFSDDRIDTLSVVNGVGDFGLETTDTDEVRVRITLTPRRGGIFSSMKAAEADVEKATLVDTVEDGVLKLELESESHEPRFEARWEVTVPDRIALELEQGVGDVKITGLAGGVDLEVGVGNASVSVLAGDVAVSVGVGDGRVRGPSAAYASASASGGVGGATIEASGEIATGEGFVSHSSSWTGSGEDIMELEVGVGDARIILE